MAKEPVDPLDQAATLALKLASVLSAYLATDDLEDEDPYACYLANEVRHLRDFADTVSPPKQEFPSNVVPFRVRG